MLKKVLKGIVIGGVVLAMAASASAADTNINIYGASAQYKFWTGAAPEYLISAGCLSSDVFSAEGNKDGRDTGISWCRDANADGTLGDNVYLRYATNASAEGINAIIARFDPDNCNSGSDTGQRLLADEGNTRFLAYPNVGTVDANKCQTVTIGASDVAAAAFDQRTEGNLQGHLGGGYTTREAKNYPDPTASPYNKDVIRPVIVPFSFFIHDDLPAALDNISRAQAVKMLAGEVNSWEAFEGKDTTDMVVCHRHAISGTLATTVLNVLRGDRNLPLQQVTTGDFAYNFLGSPVIWFNKGSSDEVRCVGQNAGGFGYADTDKCPLPVATSGKCNNVRRIKFQGYYGKAVNIVNGMYDYWAAQWTYFDPAGAGAPGTSYTVKDLLTWAGTPTGLAASGKDEFWAGQGTSRWEKASDSSLISPLPGCTRGGAGVCP